VQFALAAAVIVIAFAAAAYAEALPAPIQHVAYRVLGFAGVPNAPHHAATTPAGGHRPPAGHHRPSGTRSAHSPTSSPTPRGTSTGKKHGSHSKPKPGQLKGPARLTLTASSTTIAAGAGLTFTGSAAEHGHAVAGVVVGLFEHRAGHPGRRLAATGKTGSGGQVTLHVTGLTANSKFWLAGAHQAHSQPVRVIVIPAVSVSQVAGPGGRAVRLTVSSPLAGPGTTVVLQVQRDGAWYSLRGRRLNASGVAHFGVRRHAAAKSYRVLLVASVRHGPSVSSLITVGPF
jgi:hypothetical protein